MPTPKQPADGPSLEQYVETRFNLLGDVIEKQEKTLRERIEAVDSASIARKNHLKDEIEHTKQMLQTAQDNLKLQNERSEKTQHDINVASNEWRSTLNDFRGSVATKPELDRLYQEFGAYKLENEKRVAASVAAAITDRANKNESKEDWKSYVALIVAVLAAALAYFSKH